MTTKRASWSTWIICVGLAIATLAVYWQVRDFQFTNYDDEHYVTQNPFVLQGLTARSVWRALTTGYFSYWHPLTWMSHMLDVDLFGLNPAGHHLVSVGWHIANTLLLFLVLRQLTGTVGRAAFVAGVFALHPTHVESVAWIAERKDVLSGFFWILTISAYGWYARRPETLRYVMALALFWCGLMSKPMVITLPCVLLLLDWWPLGRLNLWGFKPASSCFAKEPGSGEISLGRALLEKVPFFALSMVSAGVTMYGVRHSGAIVPDEIFPLGLRLANVPISYARYLGKMIWPTDMAVLYPMPPEWPVGQVIGATALVLMITGLCLVLARRYPYLIIGWLWYLGTVVPTLGVVSVGWQSIADRYTYIPSIGLLIMVAWGLNDLLAAWRYRRPVLGAAAGVALVAFGVGAWQQTQVWHNNETLFRHALAVTRNNSLAHYNLGLSLYLRGAHAEAAEHFAEAIRINPRDEKPLNNLGVTLITLKRPAEATNYFARVLALKPQDELARRNWGQALLAMDQPEAAISQLNEAMRLNPNSPEACFFLSQAWRKLGKPKLALENLDEALKLVPNWPEARLEQARVLQALGQTIPAQLAGRTALEHARSQGKLAVAADCEKFLASLGRGTNAAILPGTAGGTN